MNFRRFMIELDIKPSVYIEDDIVPAIVFWNDLYVYIYICESKFTDLTLLG